MKLRRLLGAGLAVVLALSTVACGGASESSAPVVDESASAEEKMEAAGVQTPNTETENTQKTDEQVVIQLGSYPDYFWHPGAGQSGANEEQIINAALLDRLVDYDEATAEVKPMLAESWETDGQSFTFHLRSGVKMTDGSELTADDVVYSANVWKEQCASNDTGKYIESVEKVDDMTVTIKFNCVAPEILKMLTWANFGIVSEDEINAVGGLEAASQNPVMGSGKYKFKEAKTGEYVILERNEDYWDTSYNGYFKEIKFTFVNDSNAAVSAVMSGDAAVAYQMPVAQSGTFASNPDVRTYIYSNGEVEHLFFNMGEDHPTSDIKVRQGLAKALDYNAIAQVATAGFGKQSYSYTNAKATYYVADYTEEERTRNVEEAKALLAEAGYDDSNPLHITTVTLPDLLELYTVIQANLAEAGVELEIQQVDMGGFVPAMLFDKSYDIAAIGDDTTMRTPQLPQFVSPGMVFGGPNAVLEDHMDILNRLMAASDDEASAILTEYDNQLKEDCVAVNLYDAFQSTIVGKDIKGFAIRERGYIDVTTLYK